MDLQDKIRNLERKVQVLEKIIQLTNNWTQKEFGVRIPQEILTYKLDEKTSSSCGSSNDLADGSEFIEEFDLDDLVEDASQDQERSSSADLSQNPADYLDTSNSSTATTSQSRLFSKEPIVLLERLPEDHPKFKTGQRQKKKLKKNAKFTIKNEKLKKIKVIQPITSTDSTREDLICGTCGLLCERKKDLKHHLSITGHGRYPCTICSYSFDVPNRLKNHLKSHDEKRDKNIACPNCDKKFTIIKYLNVHLARESCKTLECPFEGCFLKFGTDLKFQAHLKLHNPQQDNQDISSISILGLGLGEVEKIKFECQFCNKSYASRKGLKKHSAEFHNLDEKGEELNWNFKCTWPGCDKGFEMEFFYNRHLKLHEEPDKSETEICDQCGVCVRRNALNEHKDRVHSQKKNCKCTFPGCTKLFYSQGEMKRCLRRHLTTDEEKEASKLQNIQTCDQCGKQFVLKRTLNLHISAVHHNIKPFKCSVGDCIRTFSDKRQLLVHYSVHINPKRKEYNKEFSQNRPEGLMDFLENRKACRDKYVMKVRAKK